MKIRPNTWPPGSDEYFVHEALLLAEAAMGSTSPNPPVGSVIVREGQIIGRGAHRRLGDLHAESAALLDAGDCRGASCFVSLEPCSHIGRQPSCCHLLHEAGIQRVVWGCGDADPRSAGRAENVLAGLGIKTRAGVLEEDCRAFLRHYLCAEEQQQCFSHLKLALSLDAKLACANGASQWLSGPQSLGLAHYLRWKYDGVLVGWRTVLADNPRLTVRPPVLEPYYPGAEARSFRQPVRVVLDPRFELLPRLMQPGSDLAITQLEGQRQDLPGLVIAGAESRMPAAQEQPGTVLLGLPEHPGGGLDLGQLRSGLYRLGLRSLLVEGGAGLAQSFLRQQEVSHMTLVYTPLLIGSDGLGFSPEQGCLTISECPSLFALEIEVLGRDCAISGRPVWPAPAMQQV
ncbi:bifunctional diaminohydroxyphosphoribosylaminopyrimidine deaminase/5-amino-6-(5-phosphoribosylamino)uracil reductase RibD [bacterium]|nr:bifunctional diaminohydroxyphosphoribosylaminopyrimidine deaminase/5-amino-6-(5-phosphoribosylamino)uracil reductase RibD [bacterium]